MSKPSGRQHVTQNPPAGFAEGFQKTPTAFTKNNQCSFQETTSATEAPLSTHGLLLDFNPLYALQMKD